MKDETTLSQIKTQNNTLDFSGLMKNERGNSRLQ